MNLLRSEIADVLREFELKIGGEIIHPKSTDQYIDGTPSLLTMLERKMELFVAEKEQKARSEIWDYFEKKHSKCND